MNPLLISGVALNTFIIWAFRMPEPTFVNPLLYSVLAPQLIGLVLIAMGYSRAGARAVLIGSILMIPAGLLGAFGARRVLDELADSEFEAGLDDELERSPSHA